MVVGVHYNEIGFRLARFQAAFIKSVIPSFSFLSFVFPSASIFSRPFFSSSLLFSALFSIDEERCEAGLSICLSPLPLRRPCERLLEDLGVDLQ